MTMSDIAGLCERLRADGLPEERQYYREARCVLGDLLDEAADILERQAAENKRLRSDVDFAVSCLCSLRKNYAEDLGIWDDVDKAISARAALTGED